MSTKISQMTAAVRLSGSEQMEVTQRSASVTLTASTISALSSDHSYNDSASGFVTAGFAVGDTVVVGGFATAANNLNSGTITILAAGKMTIGGADGAGITTQSAGSSVTITKWTTARATLAAIFGTLGPISVINSTTSTPPSTPADGDSYIIGASPTGAWGGFTSYLARWNAQNAGWDIIAPRAGLEVFDVAALVHRLYAGTLWVASSAAAVDPQTGTTYTLGLADAAGGRGVLTMNNGSASTVTIPLNSGLALPLGAQVEIVQLGAGQVTVAGASGVTVHSSSTLKTRAQYSVIKVTQVATDLWILSGDMQ